MAAAESHFVRASPERSSQSRRGFGPPPATPNSAHMTAEIARQRAMQAAEYYHKNVLGTRDETPSDVKHTDSKAAETYFAGFNGTEPRDNSRNETTSPVSSDAYYKQKLRSGFIDLRNSYNEKIKPRYTAYPRSASQKAEPRLELGLVPEDTQTPLSRGREARQFGLAHRAATFADRRGLYRSNSSLELEHMEHAEDGNHPGALRREYGSANSLDVISSGGGDGFFALLQGYRNTNRDQRAPAPPQMQKLLRGSIPYDRPETNNNQSKSPISPVNKVSNGTVPLAEDITDSSHSPKLKPKSLKNKDRKPRARTVVAEASGGILRKLRGTKSDAGIVDPTSKSPESCPDSDVRAEDRLRKKSFVHYDCQSIGVNIIDIIRRRNDIGSGLKRRNTTTGASAASGVRSQSGNDKAEPVGEDSDIGDGRSNDLLLSCPFFRNELGGEEQRVICLNRRTAQKRVQQLLGNRSLDSQNLMRDPACNGVAVLDTSSSPHGLTEQSFITHKGYVIEYVDQGAFYYRDFFNGFDHQNLFGIDESVGPVAISIKREKLDEKDRETSTGKSEGGGGCYQYRIIIRTSELQTTRGCILEEHIPSSSRLSSTRGLPAKDVLEYLLPELNLGFLKQALPGPKTSEQLLKVDEQGVTTNYKIGVMYCRSGQGTEEEMYNNEHADIAFNEFLDCIGQRVRLKAFDKYRGGLDVKTDSTGTYSLYTKLQNYEIMFHVSTMLPFTPNNKQQLLRKRHVGNDIVTIVFQEPGALPFTPKTVRSQFQHVFIIVRAHYTNTDKLKYSIAVSRAKDVPPFGPPIPDGTLFSKSPEFAEFLLTKAINAENAVHKSDKFTAMATRTREEYLKELAKNFVTTTSVDSGSKLSKFSLGSGRRKEKAKIRTVPDMFSKGALVWNVQVEDFGGASPLDCYLASAADSLVLMEELSRDVVFTIPCKAVVGWATQNNGLRLFYNHGECIVLRTQVNEKDEIQEIISRLKMVTPGAEAKEVTLRRNSMQQLGFHVQYEGIISDVEHYSAAWQAGLRQGTRLVEICNVAMVTLTYEQMIDLLRTSVTVTVSIIPPHDDGNPRRGCEESARPSRSSPTLQYLSPTPLDNREEDLSSVPSSRSTVRTQSTYRTNLNFDLDPVPPQRPPLPINYVDQHPASATTDLSYGQHLNISHGKQYSHDSTGSRSSDRSEGHNGDGHISRNDPYQTEDIPPADDPHFRGNTKDEASSAWAGTVTIYPAYSKDTYQGSPGSHPPRQTSSNQWSSHGNRSESPGYRGNRGQAPSGASYHSPGFGSGSRKTLSSNNLSSQSGYHRDRGHYQDRSPDSTLGMIPSSMTNLSHNSELSSHSSGSYKGSGHRTNVDDITRDERLVSQREVSLSPAGKHRQAAFVNHRRHHRDISPHGSTGSSPRIPKRSLTLGASDENLTARRRPGASTAWKGPPPGKGPPVASNTFQEDLIRLIDPDTSFTESDHSPEKDEAARTKSKKRRDRPQRIHRTLSDESMCGRGKHANKSKPTENLGSSDVIFTSAVTPPKDEELSKEQKLSPRATSDFSGGSLRSAGSQPRTASSPMLPLPDAAAGIDWSNLVDVATKAFQGTELSNKSMSMGTIGAGAGETQQTDPRATGIKNSKSSELPNQRPSNRGSHSSSQDRSGLSVSRATSSSVPWHSSAETSAQRIQELEARVAQLEREVERERSERLAKESEIAALEAEKHQLRQENARLQEESQTAAAQLRRFTEWFFNTIDRQ